MALDATAILNACVSHSLASGLFERVNGHEPKSAPGKGLTAAVWVQRIGPVPAGSGLPATTARVELRERIYSDMLAEPQDAIDPNVLSAVDTLMATYSGDFTLGSLIRNVDLLGAAGPPLAAEAGYLRQDNRLYRVMDLAIPCIVNDLWSQAP